MDTTKAQLVKAQEETTNPVRNEQNQNKSKKGKGGKLTFKYVYF